MEQTKPRRRWLRISLGGLLLVITGLCLALGWQADRVARQRRAVEMVERLGGGVTYEYRGLRFDSRAEPEVPNWLHELLGRDWFFTATSVSMGPGVSGSKVTIPSPMSARDFELLAGLPDLTRLYLSNAKESDREMEMLSRLSYLEDISLDGVEISDRGLASLASLKDLRSLSLGNQGSQEKFAITDRGLASLAALDKLEWLLLGKTSASEAGIASLAVLREITEFQIELPRGTVVQLDWLKQWPKLDTLILGGVSIEDGGCAALTACPNLTGLWLMDCQVPSDGLSRLGRTKCTFLGLQRTQISAEALASCGKLTWLYLNEVKISAEHIESLVRLPELYHLSRSSRTNVLHFCHSCQN